MNNENIIKQLIKEHLEPLRGTGTIEHFLETGTCSGGFYMAVKEIFEQVDGGRKLAVDCLQECQKDLNKQKEISSKWAEMADETQAQLEAAVQALNAAHIQQP